MRKREVSRMRRLKFRVLAVLAAGVAYSSICSATDVKHNIVGGTMGFVAAYTDALWAELIPPPDVLLGRTAQQ